MKGAIKRHSGRDGKIFHPADATAFFSQISR